jgi:hypothetical protein
MTVLASSAAVGTDRAATSSAVIAGVFHMSEPPGTYA